VIPGEYHDKENWCKVLCVIEPSMIGFIKIRDYTRWDPYKGPWKAIKHLALGFTYHEMNEISLQGKEIPRFFSLYLKACLCMKDLFFIWRILWLITYKSLAIWIEKLSCFYPWEGLLPQVSALEAIIFEAMAVKLGEVLGSKCMKLKKGHACVKSWPNHVHPIRI